MFSSLVDLCLIANVSNQYVGSWVYIPFPCILYTSKCSSLPPLNQCVMHEIGLAEWWGSWGWLGGGSDPFPIDQSANMIHQYLTPLSKISPQGCQLFSLHTVHGQENKISRGKHKAQSFWRRTF